MAEIPTLFVCHGDDGGPRVHPCRRVQEALRAAGTVMTNSGAILSWIGRQK
jgi:hypothetical protein